MNRQGFLRRNRFILTGFALLIIATGVWLSLGSKTSAFYPIGKTYHGYFFGKNAVKTDDDANILSCGVNPYSNNSYGLANFINDVGDYYFDNYTTPLAYNLQLVYNQSGTVLLCDNGVPTAQAATEDTVGASFYIQSMMDWAPAPPVYHASVINIPSSPLVSPTDPYPPEIAQGASANSSDTDYVAGAVYHGSWVAFIKGVYDQNRINFTYQNYPIWKNSAYDQNINDEFDWCKAGHGPDGCSLTPFEFANSIVISNAAGTPQYVMEQVCGNVLLANTVTPPQYTISGTVYQEPNASGPLTPITTPLTISYCDNSSTPNGTTTTSVFNGQYSFPLSASATVAGTPFCIEINGQPPPGLTGPYAIPQPPPGFPPYTCNNSNGTPYEADSYQYQTAGDTIASSVVPNCNRPALSTFDFVYYSAAPPTLTCSLTFSNTNPEPGDSVSVYLSFSVSSGTQALEGPQVSLSSNPSAGVTGASGNLVNVDYGGNAANPQIASGTDPSAPPPPYSSNDPYTFTVSTPGLNTYTFTGTITGANGGPEQCSSSVTTGYHPYFQVKGGDITTGSTGDCSLPSESPPPGIYGADGASPTIGSQLAAYALGAISGYASSELSPGAGSTDLDFANTGAGTPGSLGSAPCMPSYGTDTSSCSSSGTLDVSALAPATPSPQISCYNPPADGGRGLVVDYGNASNIPPLPLLPVPSYYDIANGVDAIIYVNGNLTIDSNITYGTNPANSWTDPSQIPSLTFVVTGNTYIDAYSSNITGAQTINTLYGNYIDPTGTIYTCNDPAFTPAGVYAKGAYCGQNNDGTPKNSLQFYGSMVANQIAFERTYGDIEVNPTEHNVQAPAELFNYGPGVWLSGYNSNNIGNNYQSITNLPPVL